MHHRVVIDGIERIIDNDDSEAFRIMELLKRGQITEQDLQEQATNILADLAIVQQGLVSLQAQLIAHLQGE